MKTALTTVASVLITLTLLSSCATQSRVYVAERPTVMVPPPPFSGAIWTGPEYRMQRGHYIYMAPRYVAPRRHHVWHNGYWDQHRGKKVWVKGRWVKHKRR